MLRGISSLSIFRRRHMNPAWSPAIDVYSIDSVELRSTIARERMRLCLSFVGADCFKSTALAQCPAECRCRVLFDASPPLPSLAVPIAPSRAFPTRPTVFIVVIINVVESTARYVASSCGARKASGVFVESI